MRHSKAAGHPVPGGYCAWGPTGGYDSPRLRQPEATAARGHGRRPRHRQLVLQCLVGKARVSAEDRCRVSLKLDQLVCYVGCPTIIHKLPCAKLLTAGDCLPLVSAASFLTIPGEEVAAAPSTSPTSLRAEVTTHK